ncbi:hypothetical protein PTKIN_Ptkin05aG0066700 [Pterospermum kingtungense]
MTSVRYPDSQMFKKMEEVEMPKTDVEKKVERILKLIKRRNRAKKEPEIVGLVEDLLKQYQSLYTEYGNLTRETGNKTGDGKGNESCSYDASSSDSEYYSSEDIEINTNIALNSNGSFQRGMAEDMEEERERAYAKVADRNHQLASKTEEKKALASDYLAALSRIQEIEAINRDLRKEVDEKEKRLSALGKAHKRRVTELEEQLSGLKTELESKHHQRRDLEALHGGKTAESKQHGETNKALCRQISEEGDEITKLLKQFKDNENNLTSKIEDSMAQISNLKKEVDYLRSQKCEAEGGIACKSNESFDQANVMNWELDSLRSQNTESEILLERKSKEISQYLIQVKTLKDELARKSAMEQIMVEEKEGLQVQVMDLESEVDALRKQKNKLEDEERSNIREINQLREEKGNLDARILELKVLLRERGLEFSAIQEDSESKRYKETAQVMTLNAEAEHLQQKLDSMKKEKSELELSISDQQRITKEREGSTNKSMESKLDRRLSTGTLNLHILERKVEDLAGEFRKKAEDNIRLLSQRITVAEKMHFENKDTCKKMKEKLEQENGALGEKLAICEAECRKLKDSMEPGKNDALNGSNSAANKLDDDKNLITCVSNVKEELVSTNDRDTGSENETEKLKSNVDLVVAEIEKENEEEMLREKVSTLEAKLSEEGKEKVKLLKAITELEKKVGELQKITKEKDQTLLGREEEKREAIRQLCLLIDYQRSRCDYLKDLISKLALRSKKKK